MKLDRRSLIKGLGVGAAALGTAGLRRARAADAIPKRLVVIVGDGMIYDDCWPRGADTTFELGEAHAPLAPWKSRLLYVDGVGMVSEEVDSGPKGNAHDQGTKHCLTASSTTQPSLPGGPSIDQAIAARLNSPNPVTKLRTLDMVVGYWGDNCGAGSGAIATAANTPVRGTWDPRDNWKRVFGDFVAPSAGAPGPAMADLLRDQQLAVLGLAKDEYGRLAAKVGKDDRQRLEAHMSLLGDLQKQMQLPATGGGASTAACAKPDAPVVPDAACSFKCYNSLDKLAGSNHTVSLAANVKIAAAALACDLTRVVSFRTSYGADSLYGYTPGMFGTGDMHDLVHKVCAPAGQQLSGNADARAVLKRQNQMEAGLVAALVKELDALPTPDGKTLLHHTVVLWGGHIGYGSHDLARLPWVLIGEAGGYFRTGRVVKLPANPKSKRGRPHNDLFLSLAEAMGTPMTAFGNPSLCSGPIAELKA